MSIGKRLFNLARSELNSLLDRAAEEERFSNSGDPDEDLYHRFSLDQISDAELEAELERRHRARKAKAEAARQASAPRPETRSSANTRTQAPPPPKPSTDQELRRAYAALEVPFGADFATVRSSYRTLMRKYHPDRHAGSPEKQKAATELAQKLTAAYKLVEKQGRK